MRPSWRPTFALSPRVVVGEFVPVRHGKRSPCEVQLSPLMQSNATSLLRGLVPEKSAIEAGFETASGRRHELERLSATAGSLSVCEECQRLQAMCLA